jgi:hypothetical protein
MEFIGQKRLRRIWSVDAVEELLSAVLLVRLDSRLSGIVGRPGIVHAGVLIKNRELLNYVRCVEDTLKRKSTSQERFVRLFVETEGG